MTAPLDGELALTVGGSSLAGWTNIRVTRRMEGCPNDFEVSVTDLYPGQMTEVSAKAGDPVVVTIGTDKVITGYIDRVTIGIEPDNHTIGISGRGKCQDLVDCSAEWAGGQISGSSVLGIAQKLAKPYGITVSATGSNGGGIPQFNLCLGETAYEIIERICRFAGLLAYEGTDGNLILSQAGTAAHSSGFAEGQNALSARMTYSMDQRFSEYDVYLQSMQVLGDLGGGGNLKAREFDKGVPRNRKRAIICESGGGGQNISIQRARWEAARRAGRSYALEVTADSWRDSAGKLWTPNQLAPILFPRLKLGLQNWLIGEVTYTLDENGTTATLSIMPPAAFLPEPILLQPTYADVPGGLNASGS